MFEFNIFQVVHQNEKEKGIKKMLTGKLNFIHQNLYDLFFKDSLPF